MHRDPRRIIALLLLFVTLTGLVMSFGESVVCAGEFPGTHEKVVSMHGHDSQQVHDTACPSSPSQSHSPNDHVCIDDCGCPCHAPLLSSSVTLTHSLSFTYLFHAELTRHIPEVYLSLFVPPDSATA
jgi:hypothetical protein